ncbi:MAG: alkaline phosphatase family protein, partial [Acidobacteriota bacterium]
MSVPPEMEAPSPSLDEVRRELRRRGYLDSRLDRFLLRDRLQRRLTTLGAILMVGLRVGLLGGPLVGLPLAAATCWMSRTAGSEQFLAFLLLGSLLSLFFGLVLACLEGLTSLLLVRCRQKGRESRSRRLTTRIAVAVGGAGVCYLGLWWRFRREVLGPADLLSLVVIIVLALLLAQLMSAAGSAVVGGEAVARQCTAPPRRSRRLSPLLAGGLTVLAAVLLFARPPGRQSQPAQAPPYRTLPTPGRLLVLGVDGLGWDGVQEMKARGMAPKLGALLDRAAVRRLKAGDSKEPPLTWTTLATGVPPAVHGVEGVLWRSLAGMPAPPHASHLVVALVQAADTLLPASRALSSHEPVSARIRLKPTVWEILGAHGRRVLAAHWWATSPVAPLSGEVLSDRVFGHLMSQSDLA